MHHNWWWHLMNDPADKHPWSLFVLLIVIPGLVLTPFILNTIWAFRNDRRNRHSGGEG